MTEETETLRAADVTTVKIEETQPAAELEEDDGPKGPHFFCDAHGARHPEDHAFAGETVGCGVRMPAGTFDGTWIAEMDDKELVRKYARFVPGGWMCPRCKSEYKAPHEGVSPA